RFWLALIVNHLLGWTGFFLASTALVNSWQDRPGLFRKRQLAQAGDMPRLGPESQRQQTESRARLLDANPIWWLASRRGGGRRGALLFTVTTVMCIGLVVLLYRGTNGFTLGIPAVLTFALTLSLKLWIAWTACATLAEARRTGAIELFLATPLRIA